MDRLKLGDVVWSIAINEEADVSGYGPSVWPWRGSITAVYGHADDPHPAYRVSAMSDEGVIDDDSNASATLYPASIYHSEADALSAFIASVDHDISVWKQEIARAEQLKAKAIRSKSS